MQEIDGGMEIPNHRDSRKFIETKLKEDKGGDHKWNNTEISSLGRKREADPADEVPKKAENTPKGIDVDDCEDLITAKDGLGIRAGFGVFSKSRK